MAEHDLIDDYLELLSRRIRLAPNERADVVAELRDHLLETAERLEAQGLDGRDAQLLAVGRLGDSDVLAGLYGRKRRVGRRAVAAALAAAALTVLGAGAVLAAAPLGNDHDLARELGFEPSDVQEPSRVEIRGVPLPQGVSADDVQFRVIGERMLILDGELWTVSRP